MYPQLHHEVSKAVSPKIKKILFHEEEGSNALQEHKTNVMGKFKCGNDGCSNRGWTSKRVAIVIRGYGKNGYNAVVFNQRCQSCKTLGVFTLDENSYVERIAYRLKKWAGVRVKKPKYDENQGPPHKHELCEGCKRGVCQESKKWMD